MEQETLGYIEKRNKFLELLTENFDKFYSGNHKDLDFILDFVNYTDRFIKFLTSRDNLNFASEIELEKINKSLGLITKIYLIDKVWDKDKADIWLNKAITAVLSEDYSFDGVRFIKGNKSVLKSKI